MRISLKCIITPQRVKAVIIPKKVRTILEKVFPIEVYTYVFMNINLNWATLDW